MDDLAQEVFVAAFTHLDSFDPKRAKFSTWLLTIARNRCCNFLKRRSQTTRELGDPVADAVSPAMDVVDSETWSRLDAALDRLSLEQRTAFVLAEIQDMPLAEIAVIEGVPSTRITTRCQMNEQRDRHDDPLEMWLAAKRDVSPPDTFVGDVMSAVERAAKSKRETTNATPLRGGLSAQNVSYLVATAAAVVCVVRVYGVVHVLLGPTPEYSVASGETNPEVPNDKRDVSRS